MGRASTLRRAVCCLRKHGYGCGLPHVQCLVGRGEAGCCRADRRQLRGRAMPGIIDNPRASLLTGVALAGLVLVVALLAGGTDRLSLLAFLVRLIHVLAAMVWV